MTVVFNIFVPTLCLAAGIGITALVATGSLTESKGALQELVVLQLETLITLVTNLFTGPSGAEIGQQLAHLVNNLLLLAPGLLEKLAAGIAAAAAAQMIVNAIPFVGWIATGIGIASDVAELLETTIEVSQSP